MTFPIFSYDLFASGGYYLFLFGLIFLDLPRFGISAIVRVLFQPDRDPKNQNFKPRISVVIASHNGAECIRDVIQSINSQSYPAHEIILVDDGSTDGTANIIGLAHEKKHITMAIFHQRRCGKSASVNHAIRFTTGDLILNIDDDTVLAKDAIEQILQVFVDANTAIASGALTVRNTGASLVTSLQTIEYQLSMAGGRSFLDLFGAMPCCSGAFSMFRRQFLIDVGGLNPGPGEDLEITLRARHFGYDVHFVERAQGSILVPDTLLKLFQQRLRWDRDELNIRMNQFDELNVFKRMNRQSEYFHMLDFLVFTLLPTIFFPAYLIYINSIFGMSTWIFLFTLYLYVCPFYLVLIAINLINSKNQMSFFDILVTPIFPFYQGVLMKAFRLFAYVMEIIFRGSARDHYVPQRVRHALYDSPGSQN
jgi:cellulose synthase/poly-beta-1,6-N-acetylglucosamine synthase-like glycosyltransferase